MEYEETLYRYIFAGRQEGESLRTAGGGNIVRDEVNRNKRSVRWTVAPIEIADNRRDGDRPDGSGGCSLPVDRGII